MSDCLFCKFSQGEIPADKLYEDDKVFVLLDIAPVNPGHALVISKEHFENTSNTPGEIVNSLAIISKKIGEALKVALGYKAYNIITNNGAEAGQVIMHTHWHVIPRKEGDGHKNWAQGKYKEGEADEISEKIKENL